MDLNTLLSLINVLEPQVVNLVMMIRHKNGTASVFTILDETDASLQTTQDKIAKWMADHAPVPPVAG